MPKQAAAMKKRAVRGSRTGPADHGAARSAGAALDACGSSGSCATAPLTSRALRTACDDASPTVMQARLSELREAGLRRAVAGDGYRLTPLGKELMRELSCRCTVRRAVERSAAWPRAECCSYAAATVRLAPSACTTLTRLPAGASGPATRQIVSSIRTVPVPSTIGFSSVNTRPTSASVALVEERIARAAAASRCAQNAATPARRRPRTPQTSGAAPARTG